MATQLAGGHLQTTSGSNSHAAKHAIPWADTTRNPGASNDRKGEREASPPAPPVPGAPETQRSEAEQPRPRSAPRPTRPATGAAFLRAACRDPAGPSGLLPATSERKRVGRRRERGDREVAIIYALLPILYGFLNSAPATINVVNVEIISIFWRQTVIYSSHFSGAGSHAVKSSDLPIKC